MRILKLPFIIVSFNVVKVRKYELKNYEKLANNWFNLID